MNSSSPRIKICGLTRYEDAALAAELGAWGLGFIFSDKSPRSCPPGTAREIVSKLNEQGYQVEKIGVFLNETAASINRVCADTGLTFAQLHGSESAQECAAVDVNVLKAIQHLDLDKEGVLEAYSCWLLMDAQRVGENWGGTGRTADWQQAKAIAGKFPLFLAGNLGEENIIEAIETVRPMGLDLSSSLESGHGVKDHQKMKRLFEVLEEAGYGG